MKTLGEVIEGWISGRDKGEFTCMELVQEAFYYVTMHPEHESALLAAFQSNKNEDINDVYNHLIMLLEQQRNKKRKEKGTS